ncbi:MAG: DUF58 domain-containing protein, partial [Rhodothermales bacterium]|nr:DUF58 domain-containing protein [Rhodothermales bacterium]
DWKVYAKTDRHYVKQYEEETNLRNYVVLDTSRSMQYRGDAKLSKMEYGAYLAGALHFLMVKQRDATGLIAFDDEVHVMLPPKSTNHFLRRLLITLEKLTANTERSAKTGAARALDEIAERITRRSLVVLITDLFENVSEHDDLLRALRHLRYRGHEVLVFHTLEARTERMLEFPDVPMIFRDSETGEEISVQPGQLRENYQAAVKHFSETFLTRCREYNIDFVEIDTNESFDVAMLAYLNKRRMLA